MSGYFHGRPRKDEFSPSRKRIKARERKRETLGKETKKEVVERLSGEEQKKESGESLSARSHGVYSCVLPHISTAKLRKGRRKMIFRVSDIACELNRSHRGSEFEETPSSSSLQRAHTSMGFQRGLDSMSSPGEENTERRITERRKSLAVEDKKKMSGGHKYTTKGNLEGDGEDDEAKSLSIITSNWRKLQEIETAIEHLKDISMVDKSVSYAAWLKLIRLGKVKSKFSQRKLDDPSASGAPSTKKQEKRLHDHPVPIQKRIEENLKFWLEHPEEFDRMDRDLQVRIKKHQEEIRAIEGESELQRVDRIGLNRQLVVKLNAEYMAKKRTEFRKAQAERYQMAVERRKDHEEYILEKNIEKMSKLEEKSRNAEKLVVKQRSLRGNTRRQRFFFTAIVLCRFAISDSMELESARIERKVSEKMREAKRILRERVIPFLRARVYARKKHAVVKIENNFSAIMFAIRVFQKQHAVLTLVKFFRFAKTALEPIVRLKQFVARVRVAQRGSRRLIMRFSTRLRVIAERIRSQPNVVEFLKGFGLEDEGDIDEELTQLVRTHLIKKRIEFHEKVLAYRNLAVSVYERERTRWLTLKTIRMIDKLKMKNKNQKKEKEDLVSKTPSDGNEGSKKAEGEEELEKNETMRLRTTIFRTYGLKPLVERRMEEADSSSPAAEEAYSSLFAWKNLPIFIRKDILKRDVATPSVVREDERKSPYINQFFVAETRMISKTIHRNRDKRIPIRMNDSIALKPIMHWVPNGKEWDDYATDYMERVSAREKRIRDEAPFLQMKKD